MTTAVKSVVIGTAGHIDHGKTTLVRALTGVDTDRLPDEKRRGVQKRCGDIVYVNEFHVLSPLGQCDNRPWRGLH